MNASSRDQATALHGMLAAGSHSSDLIAVPDQNHMSILLDLASVDGQLGRKLAEMVSAS